LEEVLGKNQDWGHLNKRRAATRLEKIERDIKWAMKLQEVRTQGAAEKAMDSERAQAVDNMRVKSEELTALEAANLKELPAPSSPNGSFNSDVVHPSMPAPGSSKASG
jgi:hypothetical protein